MKVYILTGFLFCVTACSHHTTPSNELTPKDRVETSYQKPGSAVDLHYQWLQKPSVGQAGKLQIEFVGNGLKEGVSIRLKADNSLQINGANNELQWQMAKSQNTTASQQFDVVLVNDELAYINIFVETGSGENKRARTFAIAVGDISHAQKPHPNLVTEQDGTQVIELPADSH